DDGDRLFGEFPDLIECLPRNPRQVTSATTGLVSLLRRHAEDVRAVIRTMTDRHWSGLYSDPTDEPGGVAQDSLLRLVMGSDSGKRASPGPVPENGRAVVETVTAPPTAERRFCREDDGWLVVFDGQAARIRDLDGMFYIAQLLANPGQDVRATKL